MAGRPKNPTTTAEAEEAAVAMFRKALHAYGRNVLAAALGAVATAFDDGAPKRRGRKPGPKPKTEETPAAPVEPKRRGRPPKKEARAA